MSRPLPATAQAVGFSSFGGPEVLSVIQRPMPGPAPGEVLVRVAASTVNPTDLMMRSGRQAALMTALEPPYIAGMEFSGHVVALGEGVSPDLSDQAVMGVVNPRRPQGGAHAEFVCVPAASVTPLHPDVDLVAAATIPMNGLTARVAVELCELRPGGSILVTGAAGAVGGYVVQLAKAAGLIVVADAKDSDLELVRSLGADVIVPRGEAMAPAVRQAFPQGVDALLDAALLGNSAAALVRDGGRTVSLRRSHPINDPRLQSSYVSVVEHMLDERALNSLSDALQAHTLTPRVAMTYPMRDAASAHRHLEQGGLRGRVVLIFPGD